MILHGFFMDFFYNNNLLLLKNINQTLIDLCRKIFSLDKKFQLIKNTRKKLINQRKTEKKKFHQQSFS